MSFFQKLKLKYRKLVTDKRNLALVISLIMLLIGLILLLYPMTAKTYNEYRNAKAMTEYYSFIASEGAGVTIPE